MFGYNRQLNALKIWNTGQTQFINFNTTGRNIAMTSPELSSAQFVKMNYLFLYT